MKHFVIRNIRIVFPILFLFLSFSSFLQAEIIIESVDVEADYEPYRTLPDNKSLLSSPQFLVVDDFNSGKLTNQRGSLWQTKTPAEGALDLAVVSGDARNTKRGYSLKVNYHLEAREKASFRSFLNRLDVSQAEYLVFKCRIQPNGDEEFKGRFRLNLTDWKHRSVAQDITPFCPVSPKEWGEVIIPLSLFRTLDFNQLFTIKFLLLSREDKIKGKLFVDEISFFGFNDVSFESNRDNLVGFPKTIYNEKRRKKLRKIQGEKQLLYEIAKDTWKYFVNARDKKTHLVVDHMRMGDAPLAADYTSITNIGMDMLVSIAAYDLNLISREEALKRVQEVFLTLKSLRRYQGFFYNFYDTKKLMITRSYLSSVDNGWLAISLVVVRQAFAEELGQEATEFLDSFTFEEFLDHENNQLVVGFDVPRREFGNYHYGMLVSEARATSLYAIGKGDLSEDHWWFLFRTPPKKWDWQNQKPQGKNKTQNGIDYFQGYYEYNGQKFVPSWGGSMFEVLMPTLVLKERELAPEGLGINNRISTELHIEYSRKRKYPVWGISPASTGSGRRWKYNEYGVDELSVKGYPDKRVITPHVTFLALDSLPEQAIRNIYNLLRYKKIYGEYGFYDSVNAKTKRVNPQYLALDQAMSFIAIANYLTQGSIQNRFHTDSVGKNIESLLKESFFS